MKKSLYVTGKLRYTLVKDKRDAFSKIDSDYHVVNVDLGLVYSF